MTHERLDGIATSYWHWLDDGRIQCDMCPRFCRLQEGQRGLCFVRGRQDDRIVLTTYGRSSGFCVDPIEKALLAALAALKERGCTMPPPRCIVTPGCRQGFPASSTRTAWRRCSPTARISACRRMCSTTTAVRRRRR